MAGPEPMKEASSEPPSSAPTASGPSVELGRNQLGVAELLAEQPLVEADQGGGMGDVREVAESQLGGRALVGRRDRLLVTVCPGATGHGGQERQDGGRRGQHTG